MKASWRSVATAILEVSNRYRRLGSVNIQRLTSLLCCKDGRGVGTLLLGLLTAQCLLISGLLATAHYDGRITSRLQDAKRVASQLGAVPNITKISGLTEVLEEVASKHLQLRVYIIDRFGGIKLTPRQYQQVFTPIVNPDRINEDLPAEHTWVLAEDPQDLAHNKPVYVDRLYLSGIPAYLYVVLDDVAPSWFQSIPSSAYTALIVLGTILCGLTLGIFVSQKLFKRLNDLYRNLVAITHDLKGPLTAIDGYILTALSSGVVSKDAVVSNYLRIALRNSEAAGLLLNDVHFVSKLEASGSGIVSEPFSLSDLVMEVTMGLQGMFKEKGIKLLAEVPSRLPMVRGNLALIERLIRNLLENSLKYTEKGGTVIVQVRVEGAKVALTVKDSGCGIPEAEISRLGSEFFRASNASNVADGSGMGFAIASKIAALHSTRLDVTSKQGQGTAVSVGLVAV